MNLLESLGINPKEQEKVEAKIGLELAISGRLEYKVKEQLRERIDGFEVEEAYEEEEDEYCSGECCECPHPCNDDDEEYVYESEFQMNVGGCEAHFWGVCKAETEDNYEEREICRGCGEFDEVIEHLARARTPIKLENIHGLLPTKYLIRLGHKPVFKTNELGKLFLQVDGKTYGVYGEDNVIITDTPEKEEVMDVPDDYPHESFLKMCEVVLGIDFDKEWEDFQGMGEFLTLSRNKDWQLRVARDSIPKRAQELMDLKHFLETGSWE